MPATPERRRSQTAAPQYNRLTPMITLRDYQSAAVDSVLQYWSNGGGSALVELPTGSGKSATMAELFRQLSVEYPGTRIALLTHVQELVEQNATAMQRVWPEAPLGVYSAGLNRRDGDAPIVFAGIQSVYRSPAALGTRHVLCIDECHLLSRSDDGMYQKAIAHFKSVCPGLRIVGFTATSFRTDSGLLTDGWRGKPPLFDELVYKHDVMPLIERGYLSPLVMYAPEAQIDTSGVKIVAGDFKKNDLQKACDVDATNIAAVEEIVRVGATRNAWIVFAAGVEHAEHIRDLIRKHGVECEMVLGDTPKTERSSIIKRFKSGELKCVVGNNVLTVGFDAPHIDFVALLRPTASMGLHIQMLGRGLRVSEGKTDCLVADFAGNCLKHGPIDVMDAKRTPGPPGEPPMKKCPQCSSIVHASASKCACGHVFPRITGPVISAKPLGGSIFSRDVKPKEDEWLDVVGMDARPHEKPGSPPSLKITYRIGKLGMVSVSKWLALEHPEGYGMARSWWKRHSNTADDAPTTVAEALERIDELRIPGRILVGKEGKYDVIRQLDYSVPPVIPITITRTVKWRAA